MRLNTAYIKERWNHTGFQKYLRNTGWMFFGRMFTLVVSFFVGAYIARYLGPADYGLVNYVVSFVGLFGFIASFGIDSIVHREIVIEKEDKEQLIGTAFFLKSAGSLLAIICTIIVAYILTPHNATFLLICLFSLSYIPQTFNIIEIYFQSQVLSKNVVRAQITSTIIATILKIGAMYFGKGVFWIVVIYLIEATLLAFFLIIAFKHYGHHFTKWTYNATIAKQLLRESWPLILSSMAIGIYMKIDQVMVKHILGNESAGLYAAVVKVSEVWYFIPLIISSSLSPAITKSLTISREFFESRIKKLYFFIFWTSVFIAACIFVFAPQIIAILFGDAYINALPALRLYVWAGIFVSIGIVSSQYLILHGFTKISFYNTILGMILNIILNILLIPKLELIGATIATIVAYGAASLGIILFKKTRSHSMLICKSILQIK